MPNIQVGNPRLPRLRLYSFSNLLCLKVLNQLRNKAKVTLEELRRTIAG